MRLIVNNVPISTRQIEVLTTIASIKSQNKAAKALGISVPVLHRHIKDLENKLGMNLISTTPQGTILTENGRKIIEEYNRFLKRTEPTQKPVVACSPLFSNLVLEAVSAAEREGYEINILIGDDELNNNYLSMGLVDVVIFDDPIFVYRMKETDQRHEIKEVVKDTLIHVNRGNKYLRYRYGAQRIGFSNLDLEGVSYEVVGETRDFMRLLKSENSFFINRSLAVREGLDLVSDTPLNLLIHSIFALRMGEGDELDVLLQQLGPV
ncbi:MAG: LysR family transcriptional regulator [Thermoplasmata archaeon]|nr:MAG: LysR family transcriptional regulator [Thermoplasmata archaeon]